MSMRPCVSAFVRHNTRTCKNTRVPATLDVTFMLTQLERYIYCFLFQTNKYFVCLHIK